MKKYTQRELLSEAFRDSLKRALTSDTAKGIGSVALAGLKGAAKFITPSGVQLAKQLTSPLSQSKEIFASKQSQNAIKDYLQSNKTVSVFLKNVAEKDIVNNNISPVTTSTGATVTKLASGVKKITKPEKKNAENHRLVFKSAKEPVKIFGDVYKTEFKADSAYGERQYIAYSKKTNGRSEVFALQVA